MYSTIFSGRSVTLHLVRMCYAVMGSLVTVHGAINSNSSKTLYWNLNICLLSKERKTLRDGERSLNISFHCRGAHASVCCCSVTGSEHYLRGAVWRQALGTFA
jgi:hypothetical protein